MSLARLGLAASCDSSHVGTGAAEPDLGEVASGDTSFLIAAACCALDCDGALSGVNSVSGEVFQRPLHDVAVLLAKFSFRTI